MSQGVHISNINGVILARIAFGQGRKISAPQYLE